MNYANIEKKLEKMLGSDLAAMERNMIVRDGQDYLVFGVYKISRNHVSKHTTDIGHFSSRRIALSWCIADKYQQHKLAQDLAHLDRIVKTMDADVKTRLHLSSKIKDRDYRGNVDIKIQRKKEQLRLVQERLDKCVNLAKYYQIRGFNNETARTGRTASNRTSR